MDSCIVIDAAFFIIKFIFRLIVAFQLCTI